MGPRLDQGQEGKGNEGSKPRIGTFNFERRRYPRFSVDLPLEYHRVESPMTQPARALNASEGGLLVYFPERVFLGEYLKVKLFFHFGSRLNSIETLVQVVWVDLHLGEGWGEYRSGVRFVEISSEDLQTLKNFLRQLSEK